MFVNRRNISSARSRKRTDPNGASQNIFRFEAQADDAKLIVFCHHGMRCLNVVAWLREKGISNCVSMAGGIEAWSLQVDPSVPRY